MTCDKDFVLLQMLLLERKVGPKKDRRVRKIEVTPTEFELGDMVADIQQRGMEKKGGKRHRNRRRKLGGRKLHAH